MVGVPCIAGTHRVMSSLDIFSLERRMVQFCALLPSITEMILCLLARNTSENGYMINCGVWCILYTIHCIVM